MSTLPAVDGLLADMAEQLRAHLSARQISDPALAPMVQSLACDGVSGVLMVVARSRRSGLGVGSCPGLCVFSALFIG